MLTAAIYGSLLLLFLLIYTAIYHMVIGLVRTRTAYRRLTARPEHSLRVRWSGYSSLEWIHGHLVVVLRSSNMNLSVKPFILLSLIGSTSGVIAGLLYFSSMKGVVISGLLMLIAPYIWLRSRLVARQMKNRMDFLPAVESFYQRYVLSETRNVRSVLQGLIEDGRVLPAVRHVFEQLYMALMVHRDIDESLRVFSYTLGSRWADHYAAMLRYALEDGADITEGLRELIADMRRAMLTDQADRNRLLEIRIANFSPLLFLIFFLAVNFKVDYDQAYHYYVLTDEGKNMLLDALLLIGASFGMGLYLSIRRI